MKKSLFLGVALAAIVSGCSYDEVIDQQSPQAIGFGDQFIDNAVHSRATAKDPSHPNVPLEQFDVWAWYAESKDPQLTFNGTLVNNVDGIWKVNEVRYWNKGFYTFAAVAPHANPNLVVKAAAGEELTSSLKTANKLIKSIDFTTTGGVEDLVVAEQTRDNASGTNIGDIDLTFHHLLSKVKFTFHNGFGSEEGYHIAVKNIVIKAKNAGTYTSPLSGAINTGTWAFQKGAKVVDFFFGNIGYIDGQKHDECGNELLLIPAGKDETYTVKFTVNLKQGPGEGFFVKEYTHTLSDVKLGQFELGKSYNINVTLDAANVNPDEQMNPIEFGVIKVDGWTKSGTETNLKPGPTNL